MLHLRIELLSASTCSLARIMVTGSHHAAAMHVGEALKRASGSTWFGRVSQLEIGLSSYVLVLVATSPRRRRAKLVATSPRRAKLGGVSRGMRPAGSWFGSLSSQRPVPRRGTCGF
jgi:hypothetical protein